MRVKTPYTERAADTTHTQLTVWDACLLLENYSLWARLNYGPNYLGSFVFVCYNYLGDAVRFRFVLFNIDITFSISLN